MDILPAVRQRKISDKIQAERYVSVTELVDILGVSPATVRRDLELLERNGTIERVRGGAAASTTPLRKAKHYSEDADTVAERIGSAAAQSILPNETVYLGPGKLTYATARALYDRQDVTVITNGLENAYWLARNTQIPTVITGGRVGRTRVGLDGPLVHYALDLIHADRFILEAAALCPDQGLMDSDLAQAELNRELFKLPGEIVVLVPPNRIGGVGGVNVGSASEVDLIITGRSAPGATLWDLSQMGISIISV
ncbi:MAG: DeoR/GlpR family DNA-binding transcription regulator [Chloroflexota bacterium]